MGGTWSNLETQASPADEGEERSFPVDWGEGSVHGRELTSTWAKPAESVCEMRQGRLRSHPQGRIQVWIEDSQETMSKEKVQQRFSTRGDRPPRRRDIW